MRSVGSVVLANPGVPAQDGFGPLIRFDLVDSATGPNITTNQGYLGDFGAVRNGANNSGAFVIRTTNAGVGLERFRIDKNGNVGIGTTTPTAKLDVTGTVKATAFAGDGSALTNLPGGGPATDVNCGSPCISSGEIATGAITSTLISDGTIVDADINASAAIAATKIAGTAATLGANTFTATQTITAGNLSIPTTTSASSGVLRLGGSPYLHAFGTSNTFIGVNAGNFTMTGVSNTAIGGAALGANITGNNNMALGGGALGSNTAGNSNTAIGANPLNSNTTGSNNMAVGGAALFSNTTGGSNTASGDSALSNNTTGSGNTAVGHTAGATGAGGNGNTTGSNNTFIGYHSGTGTPTQLTNASAIGANALVSASNALVLGDSVVSVGIGTEAPVTKLQVVGDIRVGTSGSNGCIQDFTGGPIAGTCSSDVRLKRDLQPFGPVLQNLIHLQPVSWEWEAVEHPEYHFGPRRSSGLVAQDVEKVFPNLVSVDDRGYKAVNYSEVPLLLLQAMRELKAENDRLQLAIEERDGKLSDFQIQLNEIKASLGLDGVSKKE